jgi:hypothetical protein
MADELTKTRDYIYVICTLIQTLLAIFGLLWWEQRNKKKDKKEARRKEEADKQKADAKQIIAILSENYDEVHEMFQGLKKSVDNLKKRKITNTGSRTFTEFDVLLYFLYNSEDKSERLEKVILIANKTMLFIKNFAIQLSTIDKGCPDIVKLKFSTEIIEMCKTIYPFATKTRQELIIIVLKFFGDTPAQEDQQVSPGCMQQCFQWIQQCFQWIQQCFQWMQTHISRCCRCCVRQNMHEPETQRLTSTPGPSNAVDIEVTRQSSANEETNEGLVTYPGDEAIENAIPYINYFQYYDGYLVVYNLCSLIDSQFRELVHLVPAVEHGKIEEAKKVEISAKIKTLWQQCYGSDLAGDLLHLICMVLFKLENDYTFSQNESLRNFVQYVEHINSPDELGKISESYDVSLRRMVKCIERLRGAEKHLLENQGIQESLQLHATSLEKITNLKLNNPQHESKGIRCSSSLPNISHACELA